MSEKDYVARLLDGVVVEWKALGDVAEIYGGLTGKVKADFGEGNAKYVGYKNIYSNPSVAFDSLESVKIAESESQNAVAYGDVLFTASSETADEVGMSSSVTMPLEDPVYLNSFSFGVRFNQGLPLDPNFSKHLFRSSFMRAQIAKTASGVTRFNVSKDRFRKVRIPLLCPGDPEKSLAIQAEIVRVLDTFNRLTTELTTELFAELTARKKQYHHYRDRLLRFEDREVEWKTLGEVCRLINGRAYKRPELLEVGKYPVLRVGNFFTNGKWYYSNLELGEDKYCEKGDLLYAWSASFGPKLWSGGKVIFHYHIWKIEPYADLISKEYLFHVLAWDTEALKAEHGTGSTMMHVGKGSIERRLVPVPSLAEQARIVAVLDKLDSLTNSIGEALPREIELRQQQYAYYRDELLSFPRTEE